ncbi:MAG: UDP-N-acetylmuramoyl-L-alanine--D-glutamate ligase [Thermoleophilia bacterium]
MEIAEIRSLAVLGLRRSGRPAALLARRRLPAATVTGLDEDTSLSGEIITELEAAGVALSLGAAAQLPAGVDLLVKSPGVPDTSPIVLAALARGITVWSEVEFATRFLENRLIGITGTNGKTTTTELTGAILRDADFPVAVGGNVGYALAEMPDTIPPQATIVAELSSFQLEHIERFRPDVAVLLNLTEDHLDRHGSYRAYVDAKLRIVANQHGGDLVLLNADDPNTLAEVPALRALGGGRHAWFSARPGHAAHNLVAGVDNDGELWLDHDEQRVPLCSAAALALKGRHNLENSLAAAAATAAAGVPAASIAETLRSFKGVPHRLQVVGVVGGVTYVNDSKATNIDATCKALTAYAGPVHLILGGFDKGADYRDLAVATEGVVKEVLLVGATAAALAEAFATRQAVSAGATPCVVCGDLENAVRTAARAALPGDVVLLSPACASWDQYRDYVARGEHFITLVDDLRDTENV